MERLAIKWTGDTTKVISNPLVPVGATIDLIATGGSGTGYTWQSPTSASITLDLVNPGNGVARFTVKESASLGQPVPITVKDSAGDTATTLLIPAPADVLSQHNILIYGMAGPSASGVSNVGLLVKETGVYTPLYGVPGIIDTTVVERLYQVLPVANATFVSCYVLNLDRLTDWAIA